MKLCHHLCVLVCMSLLLVSFTQAQNLNWNITGAGARAEGLGGAFIGVADDATAIVWNPAGLSQLERTEVSVVGRYISENSEEKGLVPGNLYTVNNTYSHFNFNFASLAVPVTAGSVYLVPAIAYQTQLDFYYKESRAAITTEGTGGASTITPGVAFRLGPIFSLGAATNIWLGSAEYIDSDTRGSRVNTNFKFNGLNFAVGALVDFEGMPNPIPLKLGFAVKTPFTLKADRDVSSTTPGFQAGTVNLDVEMPLMVGVGASVRIGENFTLASDFEMRLFKDKKITFSAPGAVSTSSNLSDHNENLGQVRVGGEYLVVLGSGVIPLRVGFRTVPTLRSNYSAYNRTTQTYDKPTGQVKGIGIAGGTGFISSSFALDAAYSREKYDEQNYSDVGVTDFTRNYYFDRFSLSLIVYF